MRATAGRALRALMLGGLGLLLLFNLSTLSSTGPIVRACLQNTVAPRARATAFAVFAIFDDLGKGGGPWILAKLVAKYGTAYSAANRKQVCDAAIRTLPTKQMQHLAVDSRGPDAAAAANDTFSDMFRRLTENAVLAERAGPALTGFKRSKKSARKLSEADLEPEKKASKFSGDQESWEQEQRVLFLELRRFGPELGTCDKKLGMKAAWA